MASMAGDICEKCFSNFLFMDFTGRFLLRVRSPGPVTAAGTVIRLFLCFPIGSGFWSESFLLIAKIHVDTS